MNLEEGRTFSLNDGREYSFTHMADVVALNSGVFVASGEVFSHPESEETSTHFMAIDMGRN